MLQTSATCGFRIVFYSLYFNSGDETVQVGRGNDPSDNQSVMTAIREDTNYELDDVYVGTNEMWFAVIGGKANTRFSEWLNIYVDIISIDLSSKCVILLDLTYLNF